MTPQEAILWIHPDPIKIPYHYRALRLRTCALVVLDDYGATTTPVVSRLIGEPNQRSVARTLGWLRKKDLVAREADDSGVWSITETGRRVASAMARHEKTARYVEDVLSRIDGEVA